jgi:Tn3 transposase DDE domain
MAEGQSMTVADVVAQVRDGRLEDFVRDAVALVVRELMEAEISEEVGAALGLVVNCIALYDTIYTQRAVDHLHATGHAVRDEDIERLSPLTHEHITLTGRYRIALPDPLRDRAAYRSLKAPPSDAAAA